jgi:hypothetical protein
VGGNVSSDRATSVSVSSSSVDGNIQITKGGAGQVVATSVGGDVAFQENRGAVEAVDNVIEGSLQADQNTGGVTIEGNRIRNNLQCSDNNPAPQGGDNRVKGDKSDQCAKL